jgi:DNA polymerase III delta prime subunit
MNMSTTIPWVEKYRPTTFDNIVLTNENKTIFKNIVHLNHFPNLILHGPPGTGKTTSIINLIQLYQTTYTQLNNENVIHLNASDDRGINVIRNQIFQFVTTNTMFGKGIKFVILDEADYMTNNAQLALKYLIQKYTKNVRYCLICNYISRIDYTLQNEFMRVRFCKLPKENIYQLLHTIKQNEGLNISKDVLHNVQRLFQSDIRSMINYLQSNYETGIIYSKKDIITIKVWEMLINRFVSKKTELQLYNYINNTSIKYKVEVHDMLKQFIYYIIYNKPYTTHPKWLSNLKFIIHSTNQYTSTTNSIHYSVEVLRSLYNTL